MFFILSKPVLENGDMALEETMQYRTSTTNTIKRWNRMNGGVDGIQ